MSPLDPEVEEAELRGFIHQAVGAALAKVRVREGFASREILEAAQEIPADLIVMGTHGASGFERWLLGSVAETVLRHAACPALTVLPSALEPAEAPVPPFKTILCAIDFSRDSQRALVVAQDLARAGGGVSSWSMRSSTWPARARCWRRISTSQSSAARSSATHASGSRSFCRSRPGPSATRA